MIKPANKGRGIVIMDKTAYIKEAERLLADHSTYKKLDSDPTLNISRKIRTILDEALNNNVIDIKKHNYLKIDHPITQVFYFLPKIHKCLEKPPGRPIVASTDSIFSSIARLLEKVLTPLVQTMKSYLRDTGHFLDILSKITYAPPESLLVTLDVNSLYMSNRHDLGLSAAKKFLITSPLKKGKIQFCMDLLNIILEKNVFLFRDQFYVQCCGTAMGSNVVPPPMPMPI